MDRWILEPVCGLTVNEHRCTAAAGIPGVGSAANTMNAAVTFANSGFSVDDHIGRALNGGSGHDMRANLASVGIDGSRFIS
jgi:endonuclease III